MSAKAIVALGAFAQLCERRGLKEESASYRAVAERFAKQWVEQADDGDHTRLAFDKPGTWSQKYNLVWDTVLGLNLFPAAVKDKEMRFYLAKQNRYGLPLDSRKDYTKLDWTLWTACLTGKRSDFEALAAPLHAFLNETPDRVPMTDWHFTSEPKLKGFIARPVVGGVYLKLLHDPAVWRKWYARGVDGRAPWAPFPVK